MYCVVYGGLGSTEHCVHNVCTVWCMGVWVVLNIVYSCVCSPLLDVMNVLGMYMLWGFSKWSDFSG